MEDSGRQKFEESWKEAFEDSGMEPSGLVWNNIDQKLDNDKMKRSVLFYQRLAAAAVIFALLIGIASTSYFQLNRTTELASNTKTGNQKQQQQLATDNEKTSSVNKEYKANTELTASTSANQSAEEGVNKIKGTQSNDEEQNKLVADAAQQKSDDSLIRKKESSSYNKEKIRDTATKQHDKQNQSIAQADEKTDQQSAKKTSDQSTKSLVASAPKDLLAKNKNAIRSNSTQASVKSNASKEKESTNQNKGLDNAISQPLIAQGDNAKNATSKNDLNQTAAVESNSTDSKNSVKKSNDANDVVCPPLIAQYKTKDKIDSKIGSNENQVAKVTASLTSSQSIQSQDNAFSRMASYFSPQLRNNKLPKGIEQEPKRELPAMPASMMASATSDKRSKENAWLSFGAAAGSYNPGSAPSYNQSPSAMQQFATSSITNARAPQSTSRSSVGSAYSIGFSIGKKIADRWMLHTGVNYMNQAISYTSNYTTYTASNTRTAFVSDYADKSSAPLAITQPYKVNSSNEFVSIPMQAGYLIIDRKFGLQWNAGVATDVFLRNTLKDQSGQSDKYTQGSGDDSPYRAFNFAALTSAEFSYKLGGQYRISLVPGVRYSFQSVLKSQSGTGSNPLVLDIGFRFRYIFNAK